MTGSCVYVGTLYAIQLEGEEPQSVARTVLGVDEELGLVQAENRRELRAGKYLRPPSGAHGQKCARLWYERSRRDYPGDRYWFHDLADTHAFFVSPLDKRLKTNDRNGQADAMVILSGPDVEICAGTPGDFLCG